MAIKTARFNTAVTVEVDYNACIHCGRCAEVCKGQPLFMADGKLKIDQERIFGCIGCGHCMCVCPQECIQVRGRDINPQDVLPMPEKADLPGYEQLYALLLSRRSVRSFQNRRVEPEKIALIIEAVSTAPMGLPPSDVEVLILDGFDKVQQFADDIIAVIRKSRWFFSPLMTALLKPFSARNTRNRLIPSSAPRWICLCKKRPKVRMFCYTMPLWRCTSMPHLMPTRRTA